MADVIPDAKVTKLQAQERKDAIRELKSMDEASLDGVREVCARGKAINVRNKQLARGNGFPEPEEWCRAAIDAAAPRNLSQRLYMMLAAQDMGIGYNADSAAELDALKDGQDGNLASAIIQAASKGAKEYTSPLSGKVYPLRTELAYDAGHWLGQIKPTAIPALNPGDIEAGANACYAVKNKDAIMLNGMNIPATQACLIIGGHFGKQIMLNAERAELQRPDETPAIDKKTKTGATRSLLGQ